MHPIDPVAEELASTQYGRFTRAQLAAAHPGAHNLIATRLRSGRWVRETSRVLRLPGSLTDRLGRTWASHLHVGSDSVVGGRSSAVLHGLTGVGEHQPTLLVPNGSHRRAQRVRIRQVTDLAPTHVTVTAGLPCTTMVRTFIELSSEVSPARLEHLLDGATMARLVVPEDLAALVQSLRRRGRSGLGAVARAAGKRLPGPGVEQSRLERELTMVAAMAGIGSGVPQHPHPGRVDSLEQVDRAFPEAMLIVEADGRSWHARYDAMKVDRRRDREAACAGWMTVRFTWEDLHHVPEHSALDLRKVYLRRRELLAGPDVPRAAPRAIGRPQHGRHREPICLRGSRPGTGSGRNPVDRARQAGRGEECPTSTVGSRGTHRQHRGPGLRQRRCRPGAARGRSRRRHRGAHRHPPRGVPGGGPVAQQGARRRAARQGLHHRRRCGGGGPHHRPRRRGDRWHRAGSRAGPRGVGVGQAGGHRQQGAAGKPRRRAVRRFRLGRCRPALRGRGGRGDPPDPPAARIPRR